MKRELIENNYLEEKLITWRIKKNNIKIPIDDTIFKHSLINIKDNNFYLNNNKEYYEENFVMEVKKIIIFKELVGYYFIFKCKSKELINEHNFISFNAYNHNGEKRKSMTRQKKYKYLFQINPKILKKKEIQVYF